MAEAHNAAIVSRCAGDRIVDSWMQWDQPGLLALLQHTGPSDRVPTPKVFLDRLVASTTSNGVLPASAPGLVVPN